MIKLLIYIAILAVVVTVFAILLPTHVEINVDHPLARASLRVSDVNIRQAFTAEEKDTVARGLRYTVRERAVTEKVLNDELPEPKDIPALLQAYQKLANSERLTNDEEILARGLNGDTSLENKIKYLSRNRVLLNE